MKNKEIELKFGFLDEGSDEKIVSVLSSIGLVKRTGSQDLKNTYFDTPDGRLFAMHSGVRIRKSNSFCEQTLKVKGENIGGLHRRSEFNVKLGHDITVPNLKKFPTEAFPENFDYDEMQKQLIEICKINFTRRTYILETLDSTFEVAYDTGEINCQGSDSNERISELEIELIESSVPESDILSMFIKLVDYLVRSPLKLTLEPFSKMHRASLLEHKSLVNLNIEPLYPKNEIVKRVQTLLSNAETLCGYFKIYRDPSVLSLLSSQISSLYYALEELDEADIPAFVKGQKELIDYSDDIDWIIDSVKGFAKSLKKLSSKYSKAICDGNETKADKIIAKMIDSEIKNKIFALPLKLRWLLSLLTN
ncbi:MAG: CYTH domain-containing protein [Succinivibrio sp.]|nr:CYTH domain-containing protein [Succinivibrio sp.]